MLANVMRDAMRAVEVSHPYFTSVLCDESEVHVVLRSDFPIRGFRLAAVEALSVYIEVASDVGFRHPDGLVDWIRGHGETIEKATNVALQHFLNLVVHPDGLVKNDFVWRSEIA